MLRLAQACALATALSVLLSGCAIVRVFRGSSGVTEAELRNRLFEYSATFDVFVNEAADRISAGTGEPMVRRLTLLWKLRMPDAATQAAAVRDPREAFVESLTLAIAQRQFFEIGAGREMFREQQSIAIDASRLIEDRAVAVGETFLNAEQLGELRTSLEQLALEHPIRGEFRREGVQAGIDKAESRGMFGEILALPMAPFRALEGVDAGAQAIREFNVTAERATDVVADMPQRVRLQLELLAYDSQMRGGPLYTALESMHTIAESSDRMSRVAETLPEETRATLEATGAELERRSAVLRQLLAEFRGAMTETQGAVTSADKLVAQLATTAEQVNQAGIAWNELVTQVTAPGPPLPPGSPPPRPFNILEYQETALSITKTAAELRLLLGDVKTAEQTLIGAIYTRVLIGGSILIGVFFAALLLYRILAARLAAPRE